MALSGFERRWALAGFEAMAPVGGPGLAPREGEVDYLRAMDLMTGAGNARARLGVRLAIWLLAFAPFWYLGRFRTLPGLPLPERTALMEQLVGHRLFLVRGLAMLFKVNAAFALLGTPTVRARSGYDPAPEEQASKGRALPVVSEVAKEQVG